jgi:hypothetical protein
MQPDNGIHRAGQFGIHLRLKGVSSENSAVRSVHVKTLHGTDHEKLYIFKAALEYFQLLSGSESAVA